MGRSDIHNTLPGFLHRPWFGSPTVTAECKTRFTSDFVCVMIFSGRPSILQEPLFPVHTALPLAQSALCLTLLGPS